MTKECFYCCSSACKKGVVVMLAPQNYLLTEQYYLIIWVTFVDLRLPRRELADEILNTFRDCCCADLCDASGRPYELPEFDDVFTEDDSRRWFGSYIQKDASGERPKCFTRIIPRLEILDLAAKLINPAPFRAIGHVC